MNQEALLKELGLDVVTDHISEKALGPRFRKLCEEGISLLLKHGRFAGWFEALSTIPHKKSVTRELDRDAPRVSGESHPPTDVLSALGPWKKGPFDIFGVYVDAEWRSDLKWDRLLEIACPFEGRRVLDVGTGNGYFLLRAKGAGAAFTLGLEPSAHYCAQYLALQRFFGAPDIALLPLPCEAFGLQEGAFDSVLSMGVLYHRRSPVQHLKELISFVQSGGELIIETIVVDGPAGHILVPEGRYAGMKNVWGIPSLLSVEGWLQDLGMKEIRSSRPVRTTNDEQRATSWTTAHSLADVLHPLDPSRTIEGHPAPERAFVVATKP